MSKRIVKFSATDVLRLSAVEITPAGNVITLGGKNGAGKTSVLNAIQMALGGKRSMPKRPIRDGAEKAIVVLDLGDFSVERIVTKKTDRLVVKTQDGAVYQKPQALLDKLFTSISFDPLAFTLKKPPEQAEDLRRLLGVDLADLDEQYQRVYDERSEVNKNGRDLKGQIAKLPQHEDAPADEVDPAELLAELKRLQDIGAEQGARREVLVQAKTDAHEAGAAVLTARADVEEAKHALEAARDELAARERDEVTQQIHHDVVAKEVDALVAPDTEAVEKQIADSKAVNRKVRANNHRTAEERKVGKLREQSETLTLAIDQVKAEREKRIAAAEFPVDGLGFGEDGITMHELPFDQASRAEQIRVSVAVGIAANPELRVFLVRDGSVLDEDSLALLTELAEKHDCQIWLEDSRTQDPLAVVIVDGRVAGVEAEEQEAASG